VVSFITLGLVSVWFIPVVILTDVGFVVSSALLLRDFSRENAREIKKIVLLWFVTGLLAFVLGVPR
jgi:polyferredoxin